MTMAMAVNTSLMSLMRSGVFCTEPHRVPTAGKVTHCFFDKTGTITADTLALEGIINASPAKMESAPLPPELAALGLESIGSASVEVSAVLGGCHSLVTVEGRGLLGDPIELSALQAIGWTFDSVEAVARPCSAESKKKALDIAKAQLARYTARVYTNEKAQQDDAPYRKEKEDLVQASENAVKEAEIRDAAHPLESLKILQRFRFLSKLQRSSVIVQLVSRKGNDNVLKDGVYSLVKGSPEAIKALLAEGNAPPWYDDRYRDLAEHGMRVLALGWKPYPSWSGQETLSRDNAENGLTFAGFIAFSCRARADSGLVIAALKESDHNIAMATGDSALTALHVARMTGFCHENAPALVLQMNEGKLVWSTATGEERGKVRAFSAAGVPKLALEEGLQLMVTGPALEVAVQTDPEFWNVVGFIKVFARMTPQGKADVIKALQRQGAKVLMCGDGGNDMGALKTADVGLALLAGYGTVNADIGNKSGEADEDKKTDTDVQPNSEALLNAHQKELQDRGSQMQKEKARLMKVKQKELEAMQKVWFKEALDKLEAEGKDAGFIAQAKLMKDIMSRFTSELMAERKALDKKFGNIYEEQPKDIEQKVEALQESSAMPIVRPGDASMAAAFTSRMPSVKNCVDLIRQGRCTLLSALQQQQITTLHCLINAYVLSALSLEGSRSSERQMMASSWLLTTASLAFSYARPIERMHRVRPLKSLFHPAIWVSLFGQALLHLGCLVYATSLAREAMAPDSEVRKLGMNVGPSLPDVTEFWRRQRLIRHGLLEAEQAEEELGLLEAAMQQWESPFLPNLMNTVVFLVETSQTIGVLAVNYKGQPWMRGLMENRPLFLSIFILLVGVAGCAWELSPWLNEKVHLTPFPGDYFRFRIVGLVIISIFATFLWDRICVAIFARDIFRAMKDAAFETNFTNDIKPLLIDCGKIILGVLLFLLGIPGWCVLGFWYYKRRKAAR